MKDKIIEVIKQSAMFLLLEIIMILIITTLLFLLNVTISPIHFPIITILTALVFLIVYRKKNIKINLFGVIIAILVFAITSIVVGKVYDVTADGNTYHKLAIGSMKNGWNPAYQSSKDFNIEKGNIFDPDEDNTNTLWIDHYAKATEIFAAVIYAFTGNIESGKCYTLILMYIVFGILLYYLNHEKKRNIFTSLAVAILIPLNPITIVQVFNYYVDGALMMSILLLLYACINETTSEDKNTTENLFILMSTIILCINIKFTGIAFSGMFCFAFYVYWLVRGYIKRKEEFWKIARKYTVFYIITVFISIMIVGYSSYAKNTIENGHPLYPLYGEGHVRNIGEKETPYTLKGKNQLSTFIISIFSKGENVTPSAEDAKITLKIPLTYSEEEIKNYAIPDIRLGGFGPLFSGIFIISAFATIYMIIMFIKRKKWDLLISISIILGVCAFLILFIEGNYWARYISYLYAIPILVLTYLLWDEKNKLQYIFGIVMALIMLINAALILKLTLRTARDSDRYVQERLSEFSEYCNENKAIIKFNEIGFESILYNLDDLKIQNYEINQDAQVDRDGYFFKY